MSNSLAENSRPRRALLRPEHEQEIAILNRIFKMPLSIDVGYTNTDPAAPCAPLRGSNMSIDYRGRLTLCCNLSGFRGATGQLDVVADLTREDFTKAYARLRHLIAAQVERRAAALASFVASGQDVDLDTGSPCLFCLRTFGKIPWRAGGSAQDSRSLPVLSATTAASAPQ